MNRDPRKEHAEEIAFYALTFFLIGVLFGAALTIFASLLFSAIEQAAQVSDGSRAELHESVRERDPHVS